MEHVELTGRVTDPYPCGAAVGVLKSLWHTVVVFMKEAIQQGMEVEEGDGVGMVG